MNYKMGLRSFPLIFLHRSSLILIDSPFIFDDINPVVTKGFEEEKQEIFFQVYITKLFVSDSKGIHGP